QWLDRSTVRTGHVDFRWLNAGGHCADECLSVFADFRDSSRAAATRQLLPRARSHVSRIEFDCLKYVRAEVNRLTIARPHRRADAQIEFRGHLFRCAAIRRIQVK